MSEIYKNRLTRIQEEYDAAQGAVKYAVRGWGSEALFAESEFEAVSPRNLKRCAVNLEPIFIVYLFSTFEDVLRDHLQSHHSHLAIPEDVRAIWLIDRVATLQRPRIVGRLRERVHEVRRYRNQLVHANPVPLTPLLDLPGVLIRLYKFVDHLPEPHSD